MMPRRKKLMDPNTLVLLKQIGKGILVLLTAGLIITAIWHASRLPAFTISEVVVSGGETINHEQVRIIVLEELKNEYLRLVPKQFSWFYPRENILESLSKIERIHDIKVELVDQTKINVSFSEYVPFALWCMSAESKDCLFINSSGYAFTKAPNLSGGSFLRLSVIGEEASLHSEITDSESFTKLIELKNLLEVRDWFMASIEIDRAGDAFLILNPASELKVSLDIAPVETIDNLFTVLSSEQFLELRPGNFEYIDLRFGNKVFVKEEATILEEELPEIATSTEAQ